VTFAVCQGSTPVKDTLVRDLLGDYEKDVDPGNITLHFGLGLVCANLDSTTNLLTIRLVEKYFWSDPRLRWVPSEHGGLTQLRVPARKIWTPDFKLYNGVDEAEVRDDVNALLGADGSVTWIPLVTYKTFSSPHTDANRATTANLKLGSWTYDSDQINLQLSETGFDTEMYLDYCPYTVTDAKVKVESKKYPCCPELYSSLEVEFTVRPRD
jgi:nicotinic acetylcholine receptor